MTLVLHKYLFTAVRRIRFMSLREIILVALFLTGPVAAGVLIGAGFASTYFPVGDDPGNWLKRINAFLGNQYPLWEENLLSYPPLLYLVGAGFSIMLGDSVLGLKAAAILAFILVPVTTGLLIYKVTDKAIPAILGSLAMSFAPSLYEMIWWGAYSNILALAILPAAVYYLLKILQLNMAKRNILLFTTLTLLLVFTHHLTAIIYATMLILLLIIFFFVARIRYLLIYIPILSALLLTVGYVSYLMVSFYTAYNPVSVRIDLIDKILWTFKNPTLLFTLTILALIGLAYFYSQHRSAIFTTMLSWIAAPLVLFGLTLFGVSLDLGRLALLLPQPLIISAMAIVPDLRGAMRIARGGPRVEGGGGEDQGGVEVEINVEKLIPLLLIATVLITSPLTAVAVNQAAYEYYDWLSTDMGRYSQQEKQAVAGWILTNTEPGDVIISEYHLGRWLEGFAGRRTLHNIPLSTITVKGEFYRSLLAEAALSSRSQIINGYFRIDDTTPLAPTFAPLIYAATEWGYDPILYLDESFVRFNITNGGVSWIEAPFNSPLVETRVSGINEANLRIEKFYHSIALRINYTIETRPQSPILVIRILANTVEGVALNSATIDFFLAWGKVPKEFQTIEDGSGFILDTASARIMAHVTPKPDKLELVKDKEFNQDKVQLKFRISGRQAAIEIRLNNPTTKPHYPFRWAVNTYDELEKIGARYIVLPKYSPLYRSIQWASKEHQGETIYVEDGLIRFVFEKAGHMWSEVPYNATVIQEEKNASGRRTIYQTVALRIMKSAELQDGRLLISYEAEPSEHDVRMERGEIPLWIAWGNAVYQTYNSSENEVVLITQNGAIRVRVSDGARITFGVDEVFKQPRLLVTVPPIENSIKVTIEVSHLADFQELQIKYNEAPRPMMMGGDRIDILVKFRELVKVYETENIAVLKLP